MRASLGFRRVLAIASLVTAAFLAGGAGALLGVCGPFTDVAADAFCPFVLEIFTLGITTGTTPTTYDPAANVSRLQMAAFLSRTVDGVLRRGNRRTAMRQLGTPQSGAILQVVTLPSTIAGLVEFDGEDLWVSNPVVRIRASDGKLLEQWTGICCGSPGSSGIALAMGKVFIVGNSGGGLYRIDPALPAGAATAVTTTLAPNARGIAFDGAKFFITNYDGTMSIVTPGPTLPWPVNTTAGGYQLPNGALYDGTNIWITDYTNPVGGEIGFLLRLNSSAGVLQTVTVGFGPKLPGFDGSNIWVPNFYGGTVSVVRASNGAVLATLTQSGMSFPVQCVFDGQRFLVTSSVGAVSLFKAADLTPLGSVSLGFEVGAQGVASDGVNAWVTMYTGDLLGARIVRF